MSNNCIICKLASGEFPSATVYEDDLFRAILDISPAAKGHTLLFPKNHVANLFELKEQEASSVILVLQKIAAAIQKATACDGINILQNNGTAAGQSILHLHFHIIPRYNDDKITIPWKQISYAEQEAAIIAENIKQYL